MILVFCAGQAELAGLHRKMHDGNDIMAGNWWEVIELSGQSAEGEATRVLDKMAAHGFELSNKTLLVLTTPGKAEDSWNPKANGVIDMDARVEKSPYGFLQVTSGNIVTQTQRCGRVGRDEDGVTATTGATGRTYPSGTGAPEES